MLHSINHRCFRIVFKAKTHEKLSLGLTVLKLRTRQKAPSISQLQHFQLDLKSSGSTTTTSISSVGCGASSTGSPVNSSSSDDDAPLINELTKHSRSNNSRPVLTTHPDFSMIKRIRLSSNPELWTVDDVCKHFWNTEFRYMAPKFDEEVRIISCFQLMFNSSSLSSSFSYFFFILLFLPHSLTSSSFSYFFLILLLLPHPLTSLH